MSLSGRDLLGIATPGDTLALISPGHAIYEREPFQIATEAPRPWPARPTGRTSAAPSCAWKASTSSSTVSTACSRPRACPVRSARWRAWGWASSANVNPGEGLGALALDELFDEYFLPLQLLEPSVR